MIKTLFKSVREYKTASLLAPLFITLEVALEVCIPFLMARIIDVGIPAHDTPYIIRTAVLLVVVALASMTCGLLSGVYTARAGAGFAANLRFDLFQKIQSFSFENIDRFSSSGLVTRLTTDITNLQNAYMLIIRILVRAPMMMLLCFIMATFINLRLSLIFLVAIVVLGSGLTAIIVSSHSIFNYVFRRYDTLNRIVQENVRGIRVVKSFVRKRHEVKKFEGVSDDIYRNFVRAEKIFALNSPLLQMTIFACMLSLSFFASRMIVHQTLTTGQFTSLMTYTVEILTRVMMLAVTLLTITIARASALRVSGVLTEESSLLSPPEPIYQLTDGAVEFCDVSFRYLADSESNTLSHINLRIENGQTIGIMGDTGSAKSTLVQLIARLYDAQEGVVKVAGRDVCAYDLATLRRKVALVPQKNILFSGSIKENLRWGNPQASDEELACACRIAQADGFISQLPEGYDTWIEQGGANVSGGQRQRLCIARALLKSPEILILDDSTSAVDTATEALLRQAFADEIPHITKIIISQRVSSISHADCIFIMNAGRIEGQGTHSQLLKSSKRYREICASQQRGGLS